MNPAATILSLNARRTVSGIAKMLSHYPGTPGVDTCPVSRLLLACDGVQTVRVRWHDIDVIACDVWRRHPVSAVVTDFLVRYERGEFAELVKI